MGCVSADPGAQDSAEEPTKSFTEFTKRGIERPGPDRGPYLEPYRCQELSRKVVKELRSEL